MMMIRGLCAGVGAAVLMSGCQVMEDSKAMRKTLEELKAKGDHIAKRADDLEREMKFKESTSMFEKSMAELFGENGYEITETNMLNKAETAMRSMLLQFWKGDFFEYSVESLDAEFQLAMSNNFSRVADYVPRDYDVNVFMPTRAYKGIAALAARMEQMQPSFVESLRKRGLPDNLSVYEVVAQALQDRDAVTQTGLLPKTKNEILKWKGEAVYLLQMRHNYLPMMVLSRASSFGGQGNLGRVTKSFTGQVVNLNDPDPAKSASPAQLKEWTHWLKLAQETRARLRAIGIEPKYNAVFGAMLRTPDFGQKQLLALPPAEVNTDLKRLQVEFARAYTQVIEEMPAKWGQLPSASDLNGYLPAMPQVTLPAVKMPDFSGWRNPPYPGAFPREKLM